MGGLFYSGPALRVLHEQYAKQGRLDTGAQLVSSSSTVIGAPAERVWAVMADFGGWASWASGIEILEFGGLEVDAPFRWRLSGHTIRSRMAVVDPLRELTWTGVMFGYKAVDRHLLTPLADGRTKVTIEESLAGPLLPFFYSERKLREGHERWLRDLAAAAGTGTRAGHPGSRVTR